MSTSFGDLLSRLRTARLATVRRYLGTDYRLVTTTLSQNELARRAGVDPAYVHGLERGTRTQPARRVVLRLAEALELDESDTTRLLIASGHWPWPDLDEETATLVAQTALAVIAGDYRPLEEAR